MENICNHFGIEESEAVMNHDAFRRMVAIKKPRAREMDPFGDYVAKLTRINPDSMTDMERFLGYYYSYLRPVEFPGKTIRSLVKVFSRAGFVYVKTIENYSAVRRRKRKILKYTGLAFHTGERILVHEREMSAGQMIWTTVLHPSQSDQASVLTGLTLGISSGMARDIACYRVVWEALGQDINQREALQGCGIFSNSSRGIPADIEAAIDNNIGPREKAFVSRPWRM